MDNLSGSIPGPYIDTTRPLVVFERIELSGFPWLCESNRFERNDPA